MKWPKSFEDVIEGLHLMSGKFFGQIPYVMLQPCMKNRLEYKVICINGEAQYVSNIKRSTGTSFSSHPHEALFQFAEDAILRAKNSGCPGLIINGILRVDIFQNQRGDFIVNELESLDAEYCSNNSVGECAAGVFLEVYWYEHIIKSLQQLAAGRIRR